MHEPAACAGIPAQQASVHVGAAAHVSEGKALASKASNSTVARQYLTAVQQVAGC
jgi:hypothetical protein